MNNTPAIDTLNLYDLHVPDPATWEDIKPLFVSYSQIGSQAIGVDALGSYYLVFLNYIQQGV
jgi:hypothetical protein